VGRRSFANPGGELNKDLRPIRFRPNSIAEGVPKRDLYLSPWHSVFLDGFLMPAKDLVNDLTITSEAPCGVRRFEYFNIACAAHELLVAEGMQTESLLIENDEHECFSNFAEYERLYGAERCMPMQPVAPLIAYSGGRSELAGLLRLSVRYVVDLRDPIQTAYQRLAERAERLTEPCAITS
jgi:hypothetical protein